MTSATTDTLETLLAERAIQRTFFHYFRLVDTDEWKRVTAECFAPGSSMTYQTLTDSTTITGHDEIEAFYEEHHESDWEGALERSIHVVGQTIIDWDGGRPTLRAAVTSWHWFRANAAAGKERPADRVVIGFEDAEFVEVEGEWLFDKRLVVYQATPVTNFTP